MFGEMVLGFFRRFAFDHSQKNSSRIGRHNQGQSVTSCRGFLLFNQAIIIAASLHRSNCVFRVSQLTSHRLTTLLAGHSCGVLYRIRFGLYFFTEYLLFSPVYYFTVYCAEVKIIFVIQISNYQSNA